jgi:predicted anti-sigma-YlaC factor YlaD
VTACPRPESLYLYLEGELGPYDARKLEEHVECCAACRDALAERRLLHEAFTSLPPFEVPEDFARSVMDSLPEPEVRKAAWRAPLAAAAAALAVGLAGFYLFSGLSVFEVLLAVNRFFGTLVAQATPLAARTLKLGSVLLKVAGDLVALGFAGLGTFSRILGPQGIALVIGLGALLTLLAVFGARRFLHQGEQS